MNVPRRLPDRLCLSAALALASAFLLSGSLRQSYLSLTAAHPLAMGFAKFALLATFGESLAQRLLTGRYLPPRFGPVPRAAAWGLLGVLITLAFLIFSSGVPAALSRLGMEGATLSGPLGTAKILTAFAVSAGMNILFAPVLMVAHKVFDLHIARYGGSLRCLLHAPEPGGLLASADWESLWRLVLFRTLIFFWIPAHTVTFLLPESLRVLFAAALGAVLGLILAWAGSRRGQAA